MKNLLKIAAAIVLFGTTSPAWAVGGGNVLLTLADAGNGQTTLSWTVGGGFTSFGISVQSPGFSGFAPQFNGWINNLGGYTDPIAVSGFGTFTNSSNASIAHLADIQFEAEGGSTYAFKLIDDATLANGASSVVVYFQPGINSQTINVPFSMFNQGTYTQNTGFGQGGFNSSMFYTLNVLAPVPEPSTMAMGTLGFISLVALRRRNR